MTSEIEYTYRTVGNHILQNWKGMLARRRNIDRAGNKSCSPRRFLLRLPVGTSEPLIHRAKDLWTAPSI